MVRWGGGGGSGGCEPRIEVIVKLKKKSVYGGRAGGGSGQCGQRVEFIVELKKGGGVGWI